MLVTAHTVVAEGVKCCSITQVQCRLWELFFVKIDLISFVAGCCKRRLNVTRVSLVMFIFFSFLCLSWVFVGLLCQYRSQLMAGKTPERPS